MPTAAEILARALYDAGCRHAFGIPGGEVLSVMHALADAGIAFNLCKHENAGGFMAEGTHHMTGAPGILVATLGPGAHMGHFSYLGDAQIDADANIGAGTITCNYDGFGKYPTQIGDRAFIGTNTAIVAPVTIGAGAYVGTGTVVTRDVPEDALAIARTEQANHDGMAKRLRAKLRARAGKTDKE